MKTLFDVSDLVILKNTGEVGKIKSIVSYIGEGTNIYEIEFGDRIALYMEKYLEAKGKNELSDGKNKDGIEKKIKDKINELIDSLGLIKGKSKEDVLLNACKVEHFLSRRDSKENIDVKFDDLDLFSLYEGLCNNDSDYIVNCLVFREILRSIGADVINVAMKDKNGFIYINNLVLLGDKYYYFDCNLERTLFIDSKKRKKDMLIAVGLGANSYKGYYEAFKVIDLLGNGALELPKNIALDDYDQEEIERIKKVI